METPYLDRSGKSTVQAKEPEVSTFGAKNKTLGFSRHGSKSQDWPCKDGHESLWLQGWPCKVDHAASATVVAAEGLCQRWFRGSNHP